MADGLVHRFADPLPLDEARARRWLGSKGASLAEMTRMGLPVPPGFTLSVEVWRLFEAEGKLSDTLRQRVRDELSRLEATTGLRFGDARAPLLLAVRSGAPTSMPGMLETVLDVGVQADIARALSESYGAERLGLDVRRRFIESFASVVLGVPREAFDAVLRRRDVRELDAHALCQLVAEYERLVHREAGEPVPEDPEEQLVRSIEGVLRSWRAPRAQQYRAAHAISDAEGTAVTLQAMVYGNVGPRSGAGVVFSRNPATGEKALFGEWLREGQGEDVVSGRRTPSPLTSAQVRRGQEDDSLEKAMPDVLAEIRALCERLEARYGDVQDVEITIERRRLFALQCRPAKRTARAAARMAVEMVKEGMLSEREALTRIEPASLRQLLTPRVPDPQVLAEQGIMPIARGLAASPGAAVGRVVLDGHAASDRQANGSQPSELILVRAETSAEDVETMRAVAGILTAAGGLTSHAAVVARAMGKPCVAGATSLHVDYSRRVVAARSELGAIELAEGDTITIDGTRGLVYAVAVPVEPAPASEHVETVLAWADELRAARVLAEATTPRLAQVGTSFGADGVLTSDPSDELLAAAGEGAVWMLAPSVDAARAALPHLRPGRDVLLAERIEELAPLANGVTLGVHVRAVTGALPQASVILVDVPDGEAAERLVAAKIPEGATIAVRGESAFRVLESLCGRAVLIVAPLDVPVGRLRAARATE